MFIRDVQIPALSKCFGAVGSKCQVRLPARGLLVKSAVEKAADN